MQSINWFIPTTALPSYCNSPFLFLIFKVLPTEDVSLHWELTPQGFSVSQHQFSDNQVLFKSRWETPLVYFPSWASINLAGMFVCRALNCREMWAVRPELCMCSCDYFWCGNKNTMRRSCWGTAGNETSQFRIWLSTIKITSMKKKKTLFAYPIRINQNVSELGNVSSMTTNYCGKLQFSS